MAVIEGLVPSCSLEGYVTVRDALSSGRTAEVFRALREVISTSEIQIECVGMEDESTVTPQRVWDYIDCFLDTSREQITHIFEVNGTIETSAEEQYVHERCVLLSGIASRLCIGATG